MTRLILRLPKTFDIDLLTEMQHILLICGDEFKKCRETMHLCKMIVTQYLFRKSLSEVMKTDSNRRHLLLKVFYRKPMSGGNRKLTLSIVIGFNFINEKEIFEKEHIVKAIEQSIPDAQAIEGSFFSNRQSANPISLFYLELKKGNGEEFTSDEIEILRSELPKGLKERIELPAHSIFMPRNEEEIMRSIISLSNQIKSHKEIPQAIISFDEQTSTHLSFTVVVVRVMPPGTSSIGEMFQVKLPYIEFIHDRIKMVGLLRKKYAKEATVFRLLLPKDPFLRLNNSIDLYKARHEVALMLLSVIGEFRDFNGGLITKQSELFHKLRELLADGAKYSEILLEKFFYSLTPVSMQTMLEPEALKTIFQMLLNSIEGGNQNYNRYSICQNLDFIFLLLTSDSLQQASEVKKILNKFNMYSAELAHSSVKVHDILYDSYIYRCDDPVKQQQFLLEAQEAIKRENKTGDCLKA